MSKPHIDFRSTAVDLAEQLQATNVRLVELIDSLEHRAQTITLLKKYMTPAQVLHAQLEIDALPRRLAVHGTHAAISDYADFVGHHLKKD